MSHPTSWLKNIFNQLLSWNLKWYFPFLEISKKYYKFLVLEIFKKPDSFYKKVSSYYWLYSLYIDYENSDRLTHRLLWRLQIDTPRKWTRSVIWNLVILKLSWKIGVGEVGEVCQDQEDYVQYQKTSSKNKQHDLFLLWTYLSLKSRKLRNMEMVEKLC